MTYGRCYHLAYHHKRARVRKKNQARLSREIRKESRKGKNFMEVMPTALKDYLRHAPVYDGKITYPADYLYTGGCWARPPYSPPWWDTMRCPPVSFFL